MRKNNIYRLYADRGPIVAVKEQGFFHRHCQGKKEAEHWKKPKVYIVDNDNKNDPLVDILYGDLGVYFVSEHFKQKMERFLNNYVEFLPLGDIRGVPYFVLNVVNVIDCLDKNRSDIFYSPSFPEKILNVHQYVFKNIPIDGPIFKVPEDITEIFVTDKFTNMILKNGITGVGVDIPNDIGFVKDKKVLKGFPT
jgi:hypothetical protein